MKDRAEMLNRICGYSNYRCRLHIMIFLVAYKFSTKCIILVITDKSYEGLVYHFIFTHYFSKDSVLPKYKNHSQQRYALILGWA